MAEFFGFEFKRKDKDKPLPSPVLEDSDDGAVIVQAGGVLGTYVDLDGSVRTEAELVTKYREMSAQPEIDMAVEEITNASISVDEDRIVKLQLDEIEDLSKSVKNAMLTEFDNILNLLDFNNHAFDIYRRWYIDGRLYYHVVIDKDDLKAGIKELRYIDPRKIRKIRAVSKKKDKESDATVSSKHEYYIFNEKGFNTANKAGGPAASQGLKIAKDSIVHVVSGLTDAGGTMVLSHMNKAIKPLNQLRTLEDSTVIYRLSRAPERRLWYIDVGNLPKMKAEQYVREIMVRHKNRLVYDASTGDIRDDRKFMNMLEDYWIPRREGGRGTQVDTLPAGQNLGEIDDIIYFQKKLYRSLNVPVSRLEPENNAFNIGRSSEITREELKFYKFISRLRRKFSALFMEALGKQLVLKSIMTIEDWEKYKKKIKVDFTSDGYFTELKDSEVLTARLDTVGAIQPYVGLYYSHDWVRRNILKQTDDDIEEQNKEMEEEASDPRYNPVDVEGGDGSGGGAGIGDVGPQKDPDKAKLADAEATYKRLINKDNKSEGDKQKLKSASQIIAKTGGSDAKRILQKYTAGVKL